MLHSKVRGNLSNGSEKKIYMGIAAILVMKPRLLINTLVPHPIDASDKIWLKLAKWFQRRRIYMYNAPGWGNMSPRDPFSFFRIINIQSFCPFPVRLSLYMTF